MRIIVHAFYLLITLLIFNSSFSNVYCSVDDLKRPNSAISRIISQISQTNSIELLRLVRDIMLVMLHNVIVGDDYSDSSVDPPYHDDSDEEGRQEVKENYRHHVDNDDDETVRTQDIQIELSTLGFSRDTTPSPLSGLDTETENNEDLCIRVREGDTDDGISREGKEEGESSYNGQNREDNRPIESKSPQTPIDRGWNFVDAGPGLDEDFS